MCQIIHIKKEISTISSFHGEATVTLVMPLELEPELRKFYFGVVGADTAPCSAPVPLERALSSFKDFTSTKLTSGPYSGPDTVLSPG